MGQTVARIDPLLLLPFIYPQFAEMGAVDPAPNLTVARGTVLGQIANAVNDVDTVTMTGTGGQWSITIANNNGTYTASNLAYNISAANLLIALTALPNIGYTEVAGVQTPNIGVTGTAGSSYVLTGANILAGYPIGIVTVDPTNGGNTPLTGGTVSVVHTTTNDLAGQAAPYATGHSDGTQNPVCISAIDFVTDQNGNIIVGGAQSNAFGNFTAPQFGIAEGHTQTVPVYYSGWFKESDLVGLDSGAVTAFKAREFILPDGTKSVRIP